MPLSQQFVRATISKRGDNVYIVTIYYSYYGLYEFHEGDVFPTLDEAKDYLINARCHGKIFLSI